MVSEKKQQLSELKVEDFDFPATVKPPGSTKALFLGGAATLMVSPFVIESVHGRRSISLAMKQQLGGLNVEGFEFPAAVQLSGSNKSLILGGAGVRGLQIQDKFVKFTAIGVYLDGNEAIHSLSTKWKGKSAEELTNSTDFFMDIVTGTFERFTRVTMILPLTGPEYAEKVIENCVAYLKAKGTFTAEEAKAAKNFLKAFKGETCPPGSSVTFTQSSCGALTIGFSKNGSMPEQGKAVIQNKPLSEAVLESIIGKNGVSPAAKISLASRISQLL